MNGDLITLGVLVVSPDLAFRSLCRQATQTASIPLVFSCTETLTAGEKPGASPVDIVIIDEPPAPAVRDQAILAARTCNPRPFVVVTGADDSVARSAAITVMERPSDLSQASALMEKCIRARVPTRVLVVDDSSTMRRIVRKVLESSRYACDVIDAEEGAAALEHLRNGAIEFVILDYNMPGQNGIETLKQIKKEAPQIGVVMMTTEVDLTTASHAKDAGAIGFLKKPFFPADIETAFDRHFVRLAKADQI